MSKGSGESSVLPPLPPPWPGSGGLFAFAGAWPKAAAIMNVEWPAPVNTTVKMLKAQKVWTLSSLMVRPSLN